MTRPRDQDRPFQHRRFHGQAPLPVDPGDIHLPPISARRRWPISSARSASRPIWALREAGGKIADRIAGGRRSALSRSKSWRRINTHDGRLWSRHLGKPDAAHRRCRRCGQSRHHAGANLAEARIGEVPDGARVIGEQTSSRSGPTMRLVVQVGTGKKANAGLSGRRQDRHGG